MKIQGFTSLEGLAARVAMAALAIMLLATHPAGSVFASSPQAISGITVVLQGSSPTYGTAGAATYLVTLTGGGGASPGVPASTLTVTGLPTDTTNSFPVTTGSCTANGCTVTATLTVTTTATTRAVSSQGFVVRADTTAQTGAGSFTVNRVALQVTAATDGKSYDGTTGSAGVPTITLGSLQGTDTAVWTQTFDNKNVGTGKTLTPAGTITDGNGGNNYSVTYIANYTGSISSRPLVVTAAASTKAYDGTNISAGSPTITSGSLLGSDTATWSQAFDNKNVGTGKTLTPTGTITDGNGGNNYAVTYMPVATGVITALSASVTPNPASKVYGATDPTLTGTLSGFIAGDGVSATYSRVAGNNVGSYTISATLSPAGALSNYSITYNTANFTITAKNLTISGITVNPKTYDTTTTATLNNGSAALVGIVGTDNVTLNSSGASGVFLDKNVGTGKAVTASGYALAGTASGNYTLSQPSGVTGNITAASLTLTGVTANSRVYNGTMTTTLSGTAAISGVLGSDSVTLGGTGIGNFANKTVGTAKPVTVTGYSLGGTDGGNYLLSLPSGLTADITAASLTITGVSVTAKVYDGITTAPLGGTAALSGVIAGDTVTLGGTPIATFVDVPAGTGKNVGTAKPVTVTGYSLTGTDAPNYTLTQPTGLTGNITAKGLTITGITAAAKPYDGTTTATLTGTATLVGVVTPDVVILGGTPIATFNDVPAGTGKNVGTAKPVTVTGYSISGTDMGNYTIAQPTGLTANITAKSLTITSGVTANNKPYNANTTATFTITTPVLNGLIAGDVVTLNSASATGTFANKNVGTAKTVTATGFALAGTGAANYTLTQPTGLTANITALVLAPTTTADSRPYNGTRNATAHPAIAKLGTDVVTVGYISALFDTMYAGNGKTVTVTGISLTGTDAPNYSLSTTTATTTANITKAALTIKANDASKFIGEVLPLDLAHIHITTTPTSLYGSDWIGDLTFTCAGAGAEAGVGTYPITPSNASGNGVDNYAITYLPGTLTVKPPLPAFLASPASKNYQVVKTGTTSSADFLITNAGGSDLVIGTVTLAGTDPTQFILGTNTCAGATVHAGGTCSVTATFQPTSVGAKSALIQFNDNTPAATHTIALSGKGGGELALNGGFNTYPTATSKIPTSWAAAGFATTDGKATAVKQEGTASVRIGNTSARTKSLTQTRSVSGGLAGNTLQLSVWARGQSIPTTTGLVRVQVQLYNGTTLVQTKLINLPTGTYAFTQRSTGFTATRAYNKVVITLIYSKPTGTVWFDKVSLLRAP